MALKESTKPNVNINTKGQKVPDDENIDINKIAQGERPKEGRNKADITAKQHKDKEAKRLVPEKVKRIQGQNDSKNIEAKRHMIEKAKIEALIEKHRLRTSKKWIGQMQYQSRSHHKQPRTMSTTYEPHQRDTR